MKQKKYMAIILALCLYLQVFNAKSQNNYFIDGYHGGIWGHYPPGYTGFISDMMDKNPFWKISLEIEPLTWDNVKRTDPANYVRFQQLAADQSLKSRIEFVNPGYGQSYLFNIQGESLIRQFELGMRKIREHFPNVVFTSYSSEEPCFTSALPQILKSFGYQYASLKNPNTCWGGYTTAYGGETVNWTGPDGTKILTVPRYRTEKLLPGSTWQTNAWNNSKDYLQDAREMGINNPIGMCLQDAGWKNGPWLGQPKNFEYQTWKQYLSEIAGKTNVPDWNFTQENVQVSLVWGAQVLQQLAQNVRRSENHLVMAEKMQAIQSLYLGAASNKDQFKTSWENLLLAQHHDSWIVPYNIVDRSKKLNWADQVKLWTNQANHLADSVLKVDNTMKILDKSHSSFKVFNTLAVRRREILELPFDPAAFFHPEVWTAAGKQIPSQLIRSEEGRNSLLFQADVPAMGYTSYYLKAGKNTTSSGRRLSIGSGAIVNQTSSGKYEVETDHYTVLIDPAKGGTITSLLARKIGEKDFVQPGSKHGFNEMKGYFYKDSTYHSSAESSASVSILENGPMRVRLKIAGRISTHPFTQYLTFIQGSERLDVRTKIDWQGNPGIGQDYNQSGTWKAEDLKKAFYNDSYKLSAFFPLNLEQQKVYKNAAFDVLESQLKNTLFNTWDSIKNNIIVNWVDICSQDGKQGIALLTDHTTSYSHDEGGTLGLTLQYSGMGLWGRNYRISGPSELNYALLPHTGKWDQAGLWLQNLKWNEPLQVVLNTGKASGPASASLINLSDPSVEVSAVMATGQGLIFRMFNASDSPRFISAMIDLPSINTATLINLDGSRIESLALKPLQKGKQQLSLSIPKFGIRTVKLQW